MTGSIRDYTTNFKFIIPEFNIATWHDYIEENFRSIDALFHNLFGINGFSGIWKTNSQYTAGQVLFVGEDGGSIYEGRLLKVVNDTNTGGFSTFSEAIEAHPKDYELYADASSAQIFSELARDWANKTTGTIITPEGDDTGEYSAKKYAQDSQSSATESEHFRLLAETDKNIALEAAVSAETSAQNSETSAQNALVSEQNSKTSETNAKTSEQNALVSEQNAKSSEDNAKVSETNAANTVETLTNNFNTYNNQLLSTTSTGVFEITNTKSTSVIEINDTLYNALKEINSKTNVLDKTMITNCLTHIPQDIKIEISDFLQGPYYGWINEDLSGYWTDTKTPQVGGKLFLPNGQPTDASVFYEDTNATIVNYDPVENKIEIEYHNVDEGTSITIIAPRNSLYDVAGISEKKLVLKKAGSKAYIPNGFEADGTTPKFDVVMIESDLIINVTGNGQFMVTVQQTGTGTYTGLVSTFFSGATAPSISIQYAYWYDTTNNVIKYTSNTGSTWTNINCSFPIGIVTVSSGTVTSIDQTFNGFGYIGSTVFALPGVRGLIPNDINADGSLKNIEYVSQNVITRTFDSTYWTSGNLLLFSPNRPNYPFSIIYPENIVTEGYDIKINNFKSDLFASMSISIGSISFDSGKITSFTPKTTFQAVDRNDLKQFELPTGSVISFAANSTPNGYLICNGAAVSRTTYVDLFAAIGTTYGSGDGSTTFNVPNLTDKFIQGSGTAGTVKEAGLPNITAKSENSVGPSAGGGGAVFITDKTINSAVQGSNFFFRTFNFDASRSNSIYGKSSTVQPPALTMRYYIKY